MPVLSSNMISTPRRSRPGSTFSPTHTPTLAGILRRCAGFQHQVGDRAGHVVPVRHPGRPAGCRRCRAPGRQAMWKIASSSVRMPGGLFALVDRAAAAHPAGPASRCRCTCAPRSGTRGSTGRPRGRCAAARSTSRSLISAISSRFWRSCGSALLRASSARLRRRAADPVLHAQHDRFQAGVEIIALRRVGLRR